MGCCDEVQQVRRTSLQEKHRAYLASLQERNQACRQLQAADAKMREQQMMREQGFSLCFSGANRRRKGLTRRHSAGSLQRASPVCRGHGSPGRACKASNVFGRQWEEHTVEILGLDGEVYGVRPTGERVAELSPSCLEAAPVSPILPESSSPASMDAGTNQLAASDSHCQSPFSAAMAAREQAVALLRLERSTMCPVVAFSGGVCVESEESLSDNQAEGEIHQLSLQHSMTTSGLGETSGDESAAGQAEEDDASAGLLVASNVSTEASILWSPAACTEAAKADEMADLAERISKLPGRWRDALLRHLEEAEADVAAETFAPATSDAVASPLRSPAATPARGRRLWSYSGCDVTRQSSTSDLSAEAIEEESSSLLAQLSPPMF